MNISKKIQLATTIAVFTGASILIYVDQAYANEPGYAPPKKQVEDGVPITDILCNERRILKHKIVSLDPICIFPDSAAKLMERGFIVDYWPSADEYKSSPPT